MYRPATRSQTKRASPSEAVLVSGLNDGGRRKTKAVKVSSPFVFDSFYSDVNKLIISQFAVSLLDDFEHSATLEENARLAATYFRVSKTFGRLFVESMIRFGGVQYILCLTPYCITKLGMKTNFESLSSQISFSAIKKFQLLVRNYKCHDAPLTLNFGEREVEVCNISPVAPHLIAKFLQKNCHSIGELCLTGNFGTTWNDVKAASFRCADKSFGTLRELPIKKLKFNIIGCWPGMLGKMEQVTDLDLELSFYGEIMDRSRNFRHVISRFNSELEWNFPKLKNLRIKALSPQNNFNGEINFSYFYGVAFPNLSGKLESVTVEHALVSGFETNPFILTAQRIPKNLTLGPNFELHIDSWVSVPINSLTCYCATLAEDTKFLTPSHFECLFSADTKPGDVALATSLILIWEKALVAKKQNITVVLKMAKVDGTIPPHSVELLQLSDQLKSVNINVIVQ
jgi:hypothetical protein